MRIVSLNLNGIRSAVNKGFLEWMSAQDADAICVQEIKAQNRDIGDAIRNPDGYRGYFHCADRPGYSGVGIYCRKKPDRVIEGLGIPDIDAEGRYIETQFGNLSIVSVYVPSGSSSAERLAIKFSFMERFIAPLHRLAQSGRDVIFCGDWNVAHREIDLRNWRSNQKNSGFLPEEREWFSGVLDKLGYVDVFRRDQPGTGAVHLVVQSRPGLGQERGLAHRLSTRHARHRGQSQKRCHLQGAAFQRPCASDHRL